MYLNKLFSTISILLLALSTTTLNVEAQPPGTFPSTGQTLQGYPPPGAPPPPKAEWTALVDQNKLPKAPLRPNGVGCEATDPFCIWTCTNCLRPESDFGHCPKKNEWALTYDDGPTGNTSVVLNALNEKGIKGSFFMIGSNVVKNPGIASDVAKSGHHIGVHTWSHTPLTSQTNEVIIAEIKWTEMAIKEATGLTPKWMRPPQGDFDDRVRGILTQLGYKIAMWNLDTFDWQSNSDPNYDVNWITGNFSIWVQNKTSPIGFASLEHDAFLQTSNFAPKAMDIVVKAKFSPQSVSVCAGDTQPYVENIKLPRSTVNDNQVAGTGTSKSGETPQAVSESVTTSFVEKSVLLTIVFGLSIIFGFVGTI